MELFERYYNSSLRFLSYRPRSELEVKDNLIKKKASPEIIEAVIARLKEYKFLDDLEFAQWFVKSRTSTKPKAGRIIKMELKQKGIDEETIGDLKLTVDDLDNAKKLVNKKMDKYEGLKRQELYEKLGGFLARRGFNWDIIKKAIDETIESGV